MAKRKIVGSNGSVFTVIEHLMLKNFWEVYVLEDEENTKDTVMAVVMGFETELGPVYLPELSGLVISRTKDLSDLAPPTGYSWKMKGVVHA